MKLISIFGILVVILLFVGTSAHAQIIPTALSITATPRAPAPGEAVRVRAATPSISKDGLIFSWTIDGRARADLSGLGADTIQLTAGALGSTLRVGVSVRQGVKSIGSTSLIIPVSRLSLTWFAETYTPRWYKGKALPVEQSVVTITAIPEVIINGQRIAPENLIYHWSYDDQDNIEEGRGKRTFRIRTRDFPQSSHDIRLVVEDMSHTLYQEGRLFILTTEPQGEIYALTPMGGVAANTTLQNFYAPTRGSYDFVFEPFFFPITTRGELNYQWSLNNTLLVGAPENPYFLTIDGTQQQGTQANISLSAKSSSPYIPTVYRSFTMSFP
ncbi:MAG: hypothetical protein Q8Q94_01745 [bacterium]|nr:hypothetical protein [bacterium]